jgi:hypothetical protein
MPIQGLPYASVGPLIRRQLAIGEDEPTLQLMGDLQGARERRYLTKSELERICNWKSPRAIHYVRSNSSHAVRDATHAALATRSERARAQALLGLSGVSIPMASSILTLLYPRRYGVLDIRVWQLLFELGSVTGAPRGVGLGVGNWLQFLALIRHFAREHGVRARDVERTLFLAHQQYQKGHLYRTGARDAELS